MKTSSAPEWSRWVLAGLAVPQLVTGTWAVVNPEHWYRSFPGFGPMLVAAEPPFNEHLASDAGSGFLATGVIALLAALWGERLIVAIAAAGLLAFAIPHFVFHAGHPAESLSDTVNWVNFFVLLAAVLVPLAIVFVNARVTTEGETE
ncbi:hypothetical protein [Antrihabitans sp. YC2-6]|uniref:hypothetical protein n=1 Tax=Antrihabitans sp. YC2-6 TaxID=2799498 RepID=UPI0018F44402|nr:hypothetical protein [Antrihabitans sp. YC2-6]MBJ8346534.1 hypothetical protein [Antrihabitans sp. YC2-6]